MSNKFDLYQTVTDRVISWGTMLEAVDRLGLDARRPLRPAQWVGIMSGSHQDCDCEGADHEPTCRLHPEYDPTPWCNGCGARGQSDCHCGPIAENE